MRPRHPFEGQTFTVLKWSNRLGVLQCLIVLEDGSRLFVPASWTDFRKHDQTDGLRDTSSQQANTYIGSIQDLLSTRTVVDALLQRQLCLDRKPCESQVKEDDPNATKAAGAARVAPGRAPSAVVPAGSGYAESSRKGASRNNSQCNGSEGSRAGKQKRGEKK